MVTTVYIFSTTDLNFRLCLCYLLWEKVIKIIEGENNKRCKPQRFIPTPLWSASYIRTGLAREA